MTDPIDRLSALFHAQGAAEAQISFFSGLYTVQIWRVGDVSGAYQSLIADGHSPDLTTALSDALNRAAAVVCDAEVAG